jgi:protein-disulfide isomerase
MRRCKLSLLLVLGCAVVMLGAAQVSAASLTPDQRAEVVQLLRDTLRSDPSILRDAIAALQADDAAHQDAAAASAIATQRGALVGDPADPVAGNPDGDVTVVEFYDPRCPYCREMVPVMAALLQADPQIRLVYKDIPILGAASVLESRALLAAQRQGGYARLQKAVMLGTGTPDAAALRGEAERQGLDGARLSRDMADPAIQAKLDDNIRLATALHVEGTPALVIGERMIPGAVSLAELERAVAAARRHGHPAAPAAE